jgi:hypothetical protein
LPYAQFDRPPNISVSIIYKTTVRSPEQLEGPHKLVLKRASVIVSGVVCGFLKKVNRPLPDTEFHLHPVCALRMHVHGAVRKLLNTSSCSGA